MGGAADALAPPPVAARIKASCREVGRVTMATGRRGVRAEEEDEGGAAFAPPLASSSSAAAVLRPRVQAADQETLVLACCVRARQAAAAAPRAGARVGMREFLP